MASHVQILRVMTSRDSNTAYSSGTEEYKLFFRSFESHKYLYTQVHQILCTLEYTHREKGVTDVLEYTSSTLQLEPKSYYFSRRVKVLAVVFLSKSLLLENKEELSPDPQILQFRLQLSSIVSITALPLLLPADTLRPRVIKTTREDPPLPHPACSQS